MRINIVEPKKVNVTLSSDELVMMQNLMHFYEKHHEVDPDAGKPGEMFHKFAGEVIVASNLCQYGHLDSFALDSVLKHNIEANPETRMMQVKRILDGNEGKNNA